MNYLGQVFIWESHSQRVDRHCKVISKPCYCFLACGKFNNVICFLVFYLQSIGSFCYVDNTPTWCLTSIQVNFCHQIRSIE